MANEENKVIMKVRGFLGNQMFSYAMYRFWEEKGVDAFMDVDDVWDGGPTHEIFLLSDYFPRTRIRKISRCEYKQDFYNQNQKKNGKIFVEFQGNRDYYFSKINETSNIFIERGWFQTYKAAFQIYPLLLNEFAFTKEVPDYITEILKKIESTNSVSIHIRCGDNHMPYNYSSHGSVCSLYYYANSINFLNGNISDPRYFIFSNDIIWVKQNIKFSGKIEFVDTSKEVLSPYYDLFLQSKCKHNILANSTFCWWSAFLNQNPDKLVLVPTVFARGFMPVDEICPPKWIRIPIVVQPRISRAHLYKTF
jgi:hypothetical protein